MPMLFHYAITLISLRQSYLRYHCCHIITIIIYAITLLLRRFAYTLGITLCRHDNILLLLLLLRRAFGFIIITAFAATLHYYIIITYAAIYITMLSLHLLPNNIIFCHELLLIYCLYCFIYVIFFTLLPFHALVIIHAIIRTLLLLLLFCHVILILLFMSI